jgi:hypothetical protein
MTSTRRVFVLVIAVAINFGVWDPCPSARAQSPEQRASYEHTLELRRARRARLRARARRANRELQQWEMRQFMTNTFMSQSIQNGVRKYCSNCRSLVSPYAGVGESCPFCRTTWGGTREGWIGF